MAGQPVALAPVSQDAGIVRDTGRPDLETDVVVVGGGGSA